MSAGAMLARVATLAPAIRRLGAEGETLRRLPDALVELLRDAGLFGILMPHSLGGSDLGLSGALAVIAAVAEADAAAGWCLLKIASSNHVAGYLPPTVAQAVWAGAGTVVAGSLNPKGRAVRDGAGWRLSGRWDWGTATGFADYVFAGAMLYEDDLGTPVPGPRGATTAVFIVPRAAVTLVDTWFTHGMRGTGSGDFIVDGALIPDARRFDPFTLMPTGDARSARLPYTTTIMLPHASLATGIARACLSAFLELAGAKTPLASSTLLRDRPAAQDAVGRALADIAASDAAVHTAVAAAEAGMPDAARLSLAATHATQRCVAAVDRLYRAAGGSAVYEASPIQRHFRDIHVAASHFLVSDERYAGAGRVALGVSASALA